MMHCPSSLALTGLLALFTSIPGVYGNELQQPLQNENQQNAEQPITVDVSPYRWEDRDAELTLYHDPKYPCSPKRNGLKAKLNIPVGTCASANFTMDDNVYLGSPGFCGGTRKVAYIGIYESADCTGEAKHPDWYDRGRYSMTGHCLSKHYWGPKTKADQWSIMFHCTEDKQVTETTKQINISLPQPAPVVEKPKRPRPTFASVSDSACYIKELGFKGAPRFIFQKPAADKCINVAPLHMLKIYRTALCPDGSDALFAKWKGKGCKGSPESKQVVDESLIATNFPDTCIEMGGKDASSYAFWCSGDLTQGKAAQSLFENDDPNAVRVHYSNMPRQRQTRVKKSDADGLRANNIFLYGFIVSLVGFNLF